MSDEQNTNNGDDFKLEYRPLGKVCSKCGENKPLSEFGKVKQVQKGHVYFYTNSRCKPCASQVAGERRRKWIKNTPEDKKKETYQRYNLKKYGMDIRQYEEMVDAQDGLCYICGKRPSPGQKKLFVDHCHATGNVRKLLCASCNYMVGYIERHGMVRINQMVAYIHEFS